MSRPTYIHGRRLHAGAGERTVWGLSLRSLHAAFWRQHGVQVVEANRTSEPVCDNADAYLLIEAEQLVLFDFDEARLRMNDAGTSCVRIRISRRVAEPSEQVVLDEAGRVRSIRRHYTKTTSRSCRVWLVRSSRVARQWACSRDRRAGSRRIYQMTHDYERDVMRMSGLAARCHGEEGSDFLELLIRKWERPDIAILGIRECQPRVWAPIDVECPPVAHGPAWIGYDASRKDEVIFGPDILFDAEPGRGGGVVELRELGEILASASPRRGEETRTPANRRFYGIAKRSIDLIAAASVLGALSPIFAVLAVLVMIDSGWPILYGHERQTLRGRMFRCWKFRTMCRNAENMKAELAAMNVCDGPQFLIEDDPRITRLGRLLRRTHLDELPQLWNVLVGDMSLVGPRPSPDRENQYCPTWREMRLSVRPGITGLWQVSRTREPGKDFQEWIQFDIEYVRRASLWLDLRICLRTLRNMLPGGHKS